MVNANRINVLRFPVPDNIDAANFDALHLDGTVQGEVLRLSVVSNGTGSLHFFESGTDLALSVLAVPSGASANAYPVVTRTDNAGAALGAGANLHANPVVNSPLYYVGSGFTSGTSTAISFVQAHWR